MNAEQQPQQSMQEEQMRDALNAHWRASAAGDADCGTRHLRQRCDLRLSPVRRANRRAKQSAGIAKPSSRQAVGLQRPANAGKR